MTSETRCEMCRWWRLNTLGSETARDESEIDDDQSVGYCHRNAPRPTYRGGKDGTLDISWPITVSDDYCGEYAPKEPSPCHPTIDKLTPMGPTKFASPSQSASSPSEHGSGTSSGDHPLIPLIEAMAASRDAYILATSRNDVYAEELALLDCLNAFLAADPIGQIRALVRERDAARNAALEEAAKLADWIKRHCPTADTAAYLRALKGKP